MPPPLSHWSTSNNYVLHPMDTMIRASMGRSGAGGASKFSLAAQAGPPLPLYASHLPYICTSGCLWLTCPASCR